MLLNDYIASVMDKRTSTKHWWNDTDGWKTKMLGHKPVLVPQISHGLASD